MSGRRYASLAAERMGFDRSSTFKLHKACGQESRDGEKLTQQMTGIAPSRMRCMSRLEGIAAARCAPIETEVTRRAHIEKKGMIAGV